MSLQERAQNYSDCFRCSNCRWVPHIESSEFAHICPSIIHGKFHSYTGGGKMVTAYALLHGVIECDDSVLDSVYSCSSCGGCEVSCNASLDDVVEPQEGIYALRQHIVSEGRLPAALQRVLANLRDTGNAAGVSSPDRGEWCRSLDAAQARPAHPEMILLVGDAALDPATWPDLHGLVDALAASGASFVIGGADEVDSGGLAFEIGDKQLALDLAQRFASAVAASGARVILTPDDALFAALRSILPRLGITLPQDVLHASQWLARQAPEGAVSPGPQGGLVTYHDTCRLGRLSDPYVPWSGEHEMVFGSVRVRASDVPVRFGNGGIYEEPRALLSAAGARIVEMPRNLETSFCCGLGGGAKAYSPEFATTAARHRLEEACSTGAKVLVTSGPDCAAHLREVAEKERLPIKVMTLLAYLQQEREGC